MPMTAMSSPKGVYRPLSLDPAHREVGRIKFHVLNGLKVLSFRLEIYQLI